MNISNLPLAIVGGGITGLSAAWELQTKHPDQAYIVLESSNRLGGKVITRKLPEPLTVIDGGPESFVTRKPEVWDLLHELGIEDQIVVPASETSGMNVLHDNTVYSIPMHPLKFLRSKVLSLRGKLRLLAEPFIKARRDNADETLADFVSRRLGTEALERLIGPVLGGIYNADPHKQSILYTSPVMRQMEREHGGLFRGALARMGQKKSTTGEKKPRFIALKDGSEALIDALAKQLTGEIRLNSAVVDIESSESGYRLILVDGESLMVSGIILATPSNTTARMLQSLVPSASEQLASMKQSSLGTMALLYRTSDLPRSEIKGLMIPRSAKRTVDAIQFTSERMPGRAEPDYTLIRVFFGGASPDMVSTDDDTCYAGIRAELADLLNIQAEPLHYERFTWQDSYPQADVGHLDKVEEIEALLPATITLAGASYRGLGVPDCVRQGRDATGRLISHLQNKSSLTAIPV